MSRVEYAVDDVMLPVTMDQFQTMTNEVLTEINKYIAPNFLNADYMAQILMSAIHALDHKHGYASKQALLESCINRISCHVTYHAVQEIQKRLEAEKAEVKVGAPALEMVTPVEPVQA